MQVNYVRVRILKGGTYTGGTDWLSQFDGADEGAASTTAGEINLGKLSAGQCASMLLDVPNPSDMRVWIEAGVGAPRQVWVNGIKQLEVSVADWQTIGLDQGPNVVHFITSDGNDLQARCILAGASGGRLLSMWPDGQDPITSGSSGPGFTGLHNV